MTTKRSTGGRRWRLLLALLAAFMLLATACGSDDETSDAGVEETESASFEDSDEAMSEGDDGDFGLETDDAGDEAFGDADEEEADGEVDTDEALAEDGAADGPLGAGGAQVTPTAADLGRKLIFTAFLQVEVDDVAAASAQATTIIEGLGGFLFGQDTQGGAEASSQLVFKVLPDDFNLALEQLGAVGELRNQTVTTDDVTERIVDLESRIEVAQLGVERLRAALEGAATLEDYAEIERLLLDRESDLEVMRGQLRTLQDRVDLATITLRLTQDRVDNAMSVRVSYYNDHDGGVSCPGQDLTSVETDSPVTVCFDIVNVGDQTLTDITVTDTSLDIDTETQLLAVFGELDELAPGQSALVAHEINPERTIRLRTRVVGFPTDGTSSEQVGPSVSTEVNDELRTFEPETDPGFSDGFDVALDILGGLWIAVKWLVGFLLPMLILLPFIFGLLWVLRAIRSRRPPKNKPPYAPAYGAAPPPPSPSSGPGGQPVPAGTGAPSAGDPPGPAQ